MDPLEVNGRASKYLTLAEAAKKAKCSPNLLKAHVVRGELVASNIGQRDRLYLRIDDTDLDRWMKSRISPAKGEAPSKAGSSEPPKKKSGSTSP